MAEFASNGKANAGLTTGIIGTSLGAIATMGGLGGLLGLGANTRGATNHVEDEYVTRYEASKDSQIANLETEIAIGKAEKYTDQKMIDVYERITSRILSNEREYANDKAAQAVINAQVGANIAVNQTNIASLQSTLGNLTKTIIPITNVCPQPMPMYNSWTAPTTA